MRQTFANGVLYMGSTDGNLYALRVSSAPLNPAISAFIRIFKHFTHCNRSLIGVVVVAAIAVLIFKKKVTVKTTV